MRSNRRRNAPKCIPRGEPKPIDSLLGLLCKLKKLEVLLFKDNSETADAGDGGTGSDVINITS